MDKLPLSTAISEIVVPTFKAYEPLILSRADQIRSTKREEFSYGPHPRQKLDVYTPSRKSWEKPLKSVLVFVYGGGLVRGDKINPNFFDGLVYSNLGHYFAENLGIPVVIIDYRLISHGAVFPSGGEDVALAIDWIAENMREDKSSNLDLFVMGNSAGGVHLSTFLLAPEFTAQRERLLRPSHIGMKLKGVVLLAVPFHFAQADPTRSNILSLYFKDDITALCPFGLLKSGIEQESVSLLTQTSVLVLTGSLDPEDEICTPGRDFVQLWRSSDVLANTLRVGSLAGHNHLSPVVSLGTGIEAEEAWGRMIIDFINEQCKR